MKIINCCNRIIYLSNYLHTHGGFMENTENTKKSNRKPNEAFMKALTPSAELAEVIGAQPIARTEAVKQIWNYIKEHNLQNPNNKRNILADEKLSKVFGKNEVTMFELTGILGKHLH
jgi:upstream activation factor subunit UAF30